MEILAIVLIALLYLALISYSVVAYVLQALSLQAVAKRRGIEKPFLAWIPIANMWLLGCISDQYQYLTRGVDRKYRSKLLWLMIATFIGLVPMYIVEFAMLFASGAGAAAGTVTLLTVLTIVFALLVVVIAVVASLYQYVAIYDYFHSCQPDSAVWYLVLSMVVPFVYPVFVFTLRNKDLGLPAEPEQTSAE